MKAIEQLTNVDKAKLLFELFPAEIPDLLQFIEGMCQSIQEDETQQRSKWENGFFGFDFWLTLLQQVETKIKRYGRKLHQSKQLFADQLFDGYLAFYTNHCIIVYTNTRQHPNRKFAKAVDLLLKP